MICLRHLVLSMIVKL